MNVAEIKNSATLSDVIGKYIELKPKGPEHWGCCPFHGERTGSFQVQNERRSWHCYGCGEHGDVIDFVMKIENCTIGQAADIITGSSEYTKRDGAALPPIVDPYAVLEPVTDTIADQDMPRPGEWFRAWNPKPTEKFPEGRFVNYRAQMVHPFRLVDYMLIGMTVRIVMPDRKIVPMMRRIWKDGRKEWAHFPFKNPRSLYLLETINPENKNPILVVEGEKCADYVRRHIGCTVITWAGGTNAAKFTDWSPLRGRNILLWPDNDPEGMGAMLGKMHEGKFQKGVCHFARESGALDVKYLEPDAAKEKGYDVADMITKDRMSRAAILEWMALHLTVIPENSGS